MVQNASYETNFRFEFDDEEFLFLNDEILTCNLPGLTLGTNEKRFKGDQIFIPGDSISIDDLTITFKHDKEYTNWTKIYTWILDNFTDGKMLSSSLYILDRKDSPIFSLSFNNIFPYNITEIQYSRTNVSPDILTFNTSFKINSVSYNSTF